MKAFSSFLSKLTVGFERNYIVWYSIYPQYTDEYETRLNMNVPNDYKSINIKT